MSSSVDLFQHVSMQMRVLDFFGLSFRIPYSKKSVYFWLGVLSRMCIGVFVFVIPTVGQIVYLIRLMLSGKAEIQEVVAISNLVLTEMLASFKLLDMRLRRNTLKLLVDQFTSQEFRYTAETLQVILARGVRISRFLFVGTLFSASMDVLGIIQLIQVFKEKQNDTADLSKDGCKRSKDGSTDLLYYQIRASLKYWQDCDGTWQHHFFHVIVVPGLQKFKTLPLKMDLIFFDVNDPNYFKFICAYQILYKPCMVSTFVVLQTLPWASMSFTVSQLDVLIYNFENMKELVKATKNERRCDENEAFRQIFKRHVLHHSAIKRFINTLQAAFSGQLASSLFLSAGIIGTTAMQFFSIESPLNNITEVLWVFAYLMIFIGMLFVDSYFGNTITVKCAHLSNVVFASPWINLNNRQKKDLVLFLARTQEPVVITASKLIHVSLETFTKVMNWTYKGFAVMNQMK